MFLYLTGIVQYSHIKMYKQNLHTHTKFCDGKDTPEEIVLKAIELGFDTIGFSIHSPLQISWDTEGYKKEITRLKLIYSDQINILCGIEFEQCSTCDTSGYDYVIGTCHYFNINGTPVGFDRDTKTVQSVIDTFFDGDGLKFAKAYYRDMATLYKRVKYDIVGHFDLITKNIEMCKLFDTQSKEYKNAAFEALHAIIEDVQVFEINTGAIARGYRTTPYPVPFILKEIKNIGGKVILSSDCHDKSFLNCWFNESLELLKFCGFDKVAIYDHGEFKEIKI